jgi:hypothetical protein
VQAVGTPPSEPTTMLHALVRTNNIMPEKLISDASISDSEKKRVTIRILVTWVNDTRH